MFAAGNFAGNDSNKLSSFMGAQERQVAPEYRGLFRYYMSVLFSRAGLEMSEDIGGPSATPKAAPTPPSNYQVFDPTMNNGRGGFRNKT
jgi:hypothetical protein